MSLLWLYTGITHISASDYKYSKAPDITIADFQEKIAVQEVNSSEGDDYGLSYNLVTIKSRSIKSFKGLADLRVLYKGSPLSLKEIPNLGLSIPNQLIDGIDAAGMEAISNLTNLKVLSLNRSVNKNLPENIGNLKNLKLLNLCGCELKELPDSIANLENLERLNLSFNELKQLPESIGNLKNLKLLNLSYNKLTELPDSIGDLKNLERLILPHNKLTKLPDSIGDLKNLKWLLLSNMDGELFLDHTNELTDLPDSIGNLENLEWLGMSGNKFTHLPDGIYRLGKLRGLDLTGNGLKTLPDEIRNLKKLEQLLLASNELTNLPDGIYQLGKLQTLNLFDNNLESLSESISQLGNLQRLDVANNLMEDLPIGIGQLTNLMFLDLSDKRIQFRDPIDKKIKLKEGFNKNKFTKLPDGIDNLYNLKRIHIGYNPIEELSETTLQNLKKFPYLQINANGTNVAQKAREYNAEIQRKITGSISAFDSLPLYWNGTHHVLDLINMGEERYLKGEPIVQSIKGISDLKVEVWDKESKTWQQKSIKDVPNLVIDLSDDNIQVPVSELNPLTQLAYVVYLKCGHYGIWQNNGCRELEELFPDDEYRQGLYAPINMTYRYFAEMNFMIDRVSRPALYTCSLHEDLSGYFSSIP